MVIPGSSRIIDVYLDKTENDKAISLHLEACDYPFIFNIKLLKGAGASFNSKMDPEGVDIIELDLFSNIMKDLADKQHIEILNEKGLRQYRLRGVDSTQGDLPEFLRYMIADLAFIQKRSSIRIPASEGLSFHGREISKINKARTVFETGQYIQETKGISLNCDEQIAELLLHSQIKNGKITHLVTTYVDSVNIFGKEIPLGKVIVQFPEMQLTDIDTIREKLSNVQPNEKIVIKLSPVSSNLMKFVYKK